MLEKSAKYPAYECTDESVMTRKATVVLSYEQILEVASIFYYVNKALASLPRWLGGIKLSDRARALHKSIHDAAINCALSLEEMHRFEKEGGSKNA
jgi:hypothetical protein